jgi:hypothetical protein
MNGDEALRGRLRREVEDMAQRPTIPHGRALGGGATSAAEQRSVPKVPEPPTRLPPGYAGD